MYITILEKLDNIAIGSTSLITAGDREYLDDLTRKYLTHLRFFQSVARSYETAYNEHRQQSPAFYEDFKTDIESAHCVIATLDGNLSNLTLRYINRIESYFRITYLLDFGSYADTSEGADVATLTGYIPVLDNIIAQAGYDLQKAGRANIIRQFTEHLAPKQPQLQGRKIVLPAFFYPYGNSDEGYYLNAHDTAIQSLIHLVNLYVEKQLALRTGYEKMYRSWKNNIRLNYTYDFGPVHMKFQSNNSVVLSFSTGQEAVKFLDTYQFPHHAAAE